MPMLPVVVNLESSSMVGLASGRISPFWAVHWAKAMV